MNKLLKVSIASLLAIGISGGTIAMAKEPPLAEKAVDYRQGAYAVMAWNFGAIGAMIKGDKPFEAKELADRADKVQLMSKMLLEGFEVKGSEKGHHTEAKPEVWKEWDKFKSGIDKLQEEAAKLAEAAKTATKAEDVKAQFGTVGKLCKDCHEKFKKD